jgi:putative transposase
MPWSSCTGYYGTATHFSDILNSHYILTLFSQDITLALERFKKFNEKKTNELCLDIEETQRKRLTDDEARIELKKCLGNLEIPHVKSLPREQRIILLKKVKKIKGLSQRQAARILGISPNLVFKA